MIDDNRQAQPGLRKGTKLGSYEILDPIGVGGMGEVYRARDTKLGREVAIKVLPEVFSQDEERLVRFEREARVLASLNHPNIASIYGLEDSDGVQFIVLELVDGETLAERIARGPIPVDEALPFFKQIAEALEAAHEKGIIHRDLKPANIKVTPDGKVKVLDFGLAKAFGEESAEGDMSESPTATFGATRAGVIMGTAPYMSPEQARGKALDKRTDLWSFGCCLYEALTGRKAFQGETDPDWDTLPEGIPWRVRELTQRCLRKERGRRLNDAGGARLELEDALAEPSVEPTVVTPSSPRRHRVVPFIVTAMASALVAGVILWGLMKPSPPAIRHFSVNLPDNDDLPPTTMRVSALSPNGKHIVYAARRGGRQQLYVRSMDRLEAKPLQGSDDALVPFFSPDSQWVGFLAGSRLQKIPIAGGPTEVLCDDVPYLFGAYWATDDAIVYSPDFDTGLWRVSASGGTPETLTVLKKEELGHRWPHVLPDGKAILFAVQSKDPVETSVVVMHLETGQRRFVVRGNNPRYVSTGHIVFTQPGSPLMAVPFDPKRLEITGTPTPVLEGVQITLSGAARFSASSDGSLLYVPGDRGTGVGRKLFWVDRQGVEEPLSEESRYFFPHPRLTPDGRRLAVTVAMPGRMDIWILEPARGTLTRLTFDGTNLRPIWSPDGRRIIFGSNRVDETYGIFSKAADGSGEVEQLAQGAYRIATSLSSDGKVLIFRQLDSNSNWDIGMARLDGESEPEIILGTPFQEHTGMLSPDDRWLAYVSNESGREEVYVCSFPVSGGKVQVSTEGGAEPMWSRDGRELFYRNGEKMMAVAVSTTPDFTPSKPTLLFEGHYETGIAGGNPGVNYDVAPDGRFLMVKAEEGSGPRQLNVILNWTEELKRLAPKK